MSKKPKCIVIKPKCKIIRPRWKLIRELRDAGDYDLIQYLVSMYREKSKNKKWIFNNTKLI